MNTPASTSTTSDPEAAGRVEIKTSLRVLSDEHSPDEITTLLGIEPDQAWRKGDPIRTSTNRFKQHGWVLRSTLGPDSSMQEQVNDLLARVVGKEDEVRRMALSAGGSVLVSVAVYLYAADPPPLGLDPPSIHGLGRLSAGVDIDLYVLP